MASSNADLKTRIATLRHEILSYKPGKGVSCDDERVVFPDKLVVGTINLSGFAAHDTVDDLRRVLHGDVKPSKYYADARQTSTKDQKEYLTGSISGITKIYYAGRAPLCAILRYGDVPKARNELKQLGITDIYEVDWPNRVPSEEDQFEWLDLLRGCLREGDKTLAANDLKKICTNPRCKLLFEKTKKEAKEANQKMFTEVNERKHETKELERKFEESLASHEGLVKVNAILKSEMVREKEKLKQFEMTLSENEKIAKHAMEMYKQRELELEKKLKSKELHIKTVGENLQETEKTARREVERLHTEKDDEKERAEKEKHSLAAEMRKKLESKQQHVDTLTEIVGEKERNETTLRQQVEELKKEHDYKEQLFEQLERETWKLRTKIQLESEIRSAEQKKKAETPQWSFIPWVTSGKQAQGGTSPFEDNSTGGLGRSDTLQAGEEPPDDDFADILQQIADDLYDEAKIDSLAGQLGILHGDIQRALMTNVKFNRVTSDGTRHMLKQWRRGVSREDEWIELTRALQAAKLVNLADQYLSKVLASARRRPAAVAEREGQSSAGSKKAKKRNEKANILMGARMAIGRQKAADLFDDILERVTPAIERQDTKFQSALPRGLKLRHLATGDNYFSLSFAFRCSKAAICHMMPKCARPSRTPIKVFAVPVTSDAWRALAMDLKDKRNVPHAVGALDGKHIAISKPFFNAAICHMVPEVCKAIVEAYKDEMSAVLATPDEWRTLAQEFEDSGMCLAVGCHHNALCLNNDQNQDISYFILGDDAFALISYLMKPYGRRAMPREKLIFNYRISRGRRVVENAFGILAKRFR
eukprot:XP_011674434.1 PREDICTED: uncharacterized protein LOC105443203 [Strongylocentrotus purpuratus]